MQSTADVVLICRKCDCKMVYNHPVLWSGAFERQFPDVDWLEEKQEISIKEFYPASINGQVKQMFTVGKFTCSRCL